MNQSGQTMVEYILVLMLVTLMVAAGLKWFKESDFIYEKFTKPLVAHLRYNYKYGDPGAQGWDEGDAKKHIQIANPAGQTFRIFTPRD